MNAVQAPEHSLASRIGHIARVLAGERFPSGERAALRRMSPGLSPPLAFHRFTLHHLPDGWERHEADWVTVVAGIALMAPHAHRADQPLGRALAEAGYSEARLERLLAADGKTRRTLLLRAGRFLAAKAAPFNWTEAAQLLLTSDQDQTKREKLHRRIARDFYYHKER